MANVPSIVGVFWPYVYMEGIWVFKPWSNSFFWCCGSLFLNGTFGHENMTCWPKCNVCVLEARIRYVWGIMTLGPSPMGMGWMTWWYFGAPEWFYNLRRSYSSYYSKLFNIWITKLHWRICEIKMIPIRITLVKWWWTTRDSPYGWWEGPHKFFCAIYPIFRYLGYFSWFVAWYHCIKQVAYHCWQCRWYWVDRLQGLE